MIKLAKDEPFWLEILPGQRTQFRPVDTRAMLIARARGLEALRQAETDGADALGAQAASQQAFVRSLAAGGIAAWEEVGDAEGEPIEPSPQAVESYLDNWRIFDAVDRLYVWPAIARDAEKNA